MEEKLTLRTILLSRLSRRSRRISSLSLSPLPSPPKPPKRLPLNRQTPPRIPNPHIHILLPHPRQLRLDNISVALFIDLNCRTAQTTGRVEEGVVEEVGGGAAGDGGGGGGLGVGLVEELEEGAEEGVGERHCGYSVGGGGGSVVAVVIVSRVDYVIRSCSAEVQPQRPTLFIPTNSHPQRTLAKFRHTRMSKESSQ